MKNAEIPGAVWLLLLVIVPDLAQWLTEYFGNIWWVPAVAALILILYKGYLTVRDATKVEDSKPPVGESSAPVGTDSFSPSAKRGFDDVGLIRKFALGG